MYLSVGLRVFRGDVCGFGVWFNDSLGVHLSRSRKESAISQCGVSATASLAHMRFWGRWGLWGAFIIAL